MSRRSRTLGAAAVLAAIASAGASAQEKPFTVNPTMVKGSPAAAVTIFEFSDYQ